MLWLVIVFANDFCYITTTTLMSSLNHDCKRIPCNIISLFLKIATVFLSEISFSRFQDIVCKPDIGEAMKRTLRYNIKCKVDFRQSLSIQLHSKVF